MGMTKDQIRHRINQINSRLLNILCRGSEREQLLKEREQLRKEFWK